MKAAAQTRETFRFPIRVYYEDTDAAGVVYYANYLRYMERTRTEWLGSLGFDLATFESGHGIAFVVHRVAIEYRLPARLGDRLDATLALVELRRARMVALQQVLARCGNAHRRTRHGRLHRSHDVPAGADSADAAQPTGGSRLNVNTDLSFLTLVAQASLVVQAVLLLLAALSLWSWWQIFLKMFQLKRTTRDTDAFENEFWKGGDLNELYQSSSKSRTGSGLEHIFTAGFREYAKHRKQGSTAAATMDSARRAMRATFQREIDALDAHLAGLATVGSVSPYIGLFGTVWGIMNAFRGLANVSQATLAHVAPGIAEALIATAIGLFAAIPAVVAYNRYTHDVDRLAVRYETFIEEFSNILQRQS